MSFRKDAQIRKYKNEVIKQTSVRNNFQIKESLKEKETKQYRIRSQRDINLYNSNASYRYIDISAVK